MVLFLKRHFLAVRKRTLSPALQLRFLQRLSRLLSNGYPLIASLDRIQWDRQLSRTAKQIKTALKNGEAIDKSLNAPNSILQLPLTFILLEIVVISNQA